MGDPRGPRAPSQDPALVLRTAAWVSFLLLLFVFAERQQPPRGLAGLPQNSLGRTVSLWEIHRPPPFDSPRRLSGPAWTRQQDREVVPHLRPSGQPRPARADSPPLPHAASFGAANLCSPWAGSTERTQSRPWQVQSGMSHGPFPGLGDILIRLPESGCGGQKGPACGQRAHFGSLLSSGFTKYVGTCGAAPSKPGSGVHVPEPVSACAFLRPRDSRCWGSASCVRGSKYGRQRGSSHNGLQRSGAGLLRGGPAFARTWSPRPSEGLLRRLGQSPLVGREGRKSVEMSNCPGVRPSWDVTSLRSSPLHGQNQGWHLGVLSPAAHTAHLGSAPSGWGRRGLLGDQNLGWMPSRVPVAVLQGWA